MVAKKELASIFKKKVLFLTKAIKDIQEMRAKVRNMKEWLEENREYIHYTNPPECLFNHAITETIFLKHDVNSLDNLLCILSCVERKPIESYKEKKGCCDIATVTS